MLISVAAVRKAPKGRLRSGLIWHDELMHSLRSLSHYSLLACVLATVMLPAQDLSYSRDIRPILSKNCFKCHGPDAKRRKAKLRLDRPSAVQREHMVEHITSADPKAIMPPPKSGKKLSPAEIKLLTRWVEQGSKYEQHWSFVPPRRPSLPPAENRELHPIDRFVHSTLQTAGMTPSDPADRLTLIRRVSLDLIGLPPTPGEADAFVADHSPDAYEKIVERLLASPRYGERWARRWLDLARYADTNGYEKDRERSIWPYRDWVIKALNADMPYDQFAIEQVAGDMLPNATSSQLIATGFHRNTMLNEEGGIDPLEYRYYAVNDRVQTTGTVFLGLTLSCAQCHTHKYDPITHSEYFGLLAFLNNSDEPTYRLPDAAKDAKAELRRESAIRKQKGLAALWPVDAKQSLGERFDGWLSETRASVVAWQALQANEATSNLPSISLEADGVVFCSGDTSKHDTYRLTYTAGTTPITALRLEALPDVRLPDGGPGMTYYEGTIGDFFLREFKLTAAGKAVAIASATESYSKNRYGNQAVSAALAADGDLQTGWSVHGRIGERHVAVFVLAEPLAAGTTFELEMHFGRHFGSSLGKFCLSATGDARGGKAMAFGPEIEGLLRRADDSLAAEDRDRLRETFLLGAPEVAAHAKKIEKLRRLPAYTTTLVFDERAPGHMRPTHRHHRGEFLQPKELVLPGVPEVLHAWSEGRSKDRLGFARWLVSSDNPLVARVAVNRHWAAFFGTGLVRTLDDFGAQGEIPSHPELLDWLSTEFVEGGWSLKSLHRLIVTSATYKQSSLVSADARQRDPENRWLGRAPRFRLEAEILRDAALFSAGVLSSKMFGPPVRPPQPSGITEFAYGNPKWKASKGEGRRRRSLYTFAKRTTPYALFQTFDAPSGEACKARRDKSNTALQALSLINDPQLLEIAQAMGETVDRYALEHGDNLNVTLVHAFRRVLTRHPSAEELVVLTAFVQRQQTRFAADSASARAVAGIAAKVESGEVEPGKAELRMEDLSEARIVSRATWTSLCRALFGLDETITRN